MKQLFYYLKPYWGAALLNVLFNVLTALFSIISLMLLKPVLDILFNTKMPEAPSYEGASWLEIPILWFNRYLIEYINLYGQKAALIWVCMVVIACFFLKNFFRYLALYVMAPVRNGVEFDIRNQVFEKLLQLPLSYFSNERKGDLMSRLSSDVSEIQWSILRSLETIVRSPIILLGSLFVMFFTSAQLTLFSFGLFLVAGLIIGRLSKQLRRNSKDAQGGLGTILSMVDEAIGGLRVIQGFSAEHYQIKKFKEENSKLTDLNNSIQRRRELASPLSEFLGILIIAFLLLYGGNLVFEQHFQSSTFIMFILMFYNIIDPAKSFASAMYDIQKGRAAVDRIAAIMNSSVSIADAENALPVSDFHTSLQVEHLGFSYDGQTVVLKDINFELKKGQSIALVGVSGSGKSTLADLLPRFYDPSEGRILLDGQDIKNYKLRDLRSLFGIVTQDAILFNDSIYNNILFGLENVSKAEVERAARIAHAEEFILQTEKGYDTVIGDRGMKLSGGQRQRLTLARAILRNPPILLMDEATSALDSESEKAVQSALNELLTQCSAIIVAHRLSTIQYVNLILVLQDGSIVERGTHEELLKINGVYAKLVALQKL